jgi:hypothetical protein
LIFKPANACRIYGSVILNLLIMKTLISKTVTVFFLLFAAFSVYTYSQVFSPSALITIPGNNIEYDVASPGFLQQTAAYICWVNVLDSVYTIYLKQIAPAMGNNIVVASGSSFKSRPVIAGFDRDIRISWQTKNNYWEVRSKHFIDNMPVDSALILDSLTSEPLITTDFYRLAWIENGNLYVKKFAQPAGVKFLVDSLNCTAPQLYKLNELDHSFMLYEKDYADSSKIYLFAEYVQGPPQYNYRTVSEGLFSRNPRFGLDKGISFQTRENNIWKSVGYEFYYDISPIPAFTSMNAACNFTNPVMFSYPIPVTDKWNFTNYFLLFESDSLPGNKEICMNTFLYALYDSLVNISKAPGNDYMPGTAYMPDSPQVYIAVFWEHEFNGKTDIWMAKDVFNPITGNIENANRTKLTFNLQQNYPNPFNPSTSIRFTLPEEENIKLDIYNISGQKVCALLKGKYSAGSHEIKWDARGFASGIYFCRLVSGGRQITKKIILMK